jgi:hypothetical protein
MQTRIIDHSGNAAALSQDKSRASIDFQILLGEAIRNVEALGPEFTGVTEKLLLLASVWRNNSSEIRRE